MDRIALAFSPLRDAPPRDILDWSRRAEALGFAGIFVPESFNDSLAYAQAVAGVTARAKVGTAITNVYLRHPTLLAQQAAAVQELSGGRLLLGLGVGHRPVNASLGIDMKQRDVAKAELAVSDEMADAVTLVGDPVHCRERLRAYEMAGATMRSRDREPRAVRTRRGHLRDRGRRHLVRASRGGPRAPRPALRGLRWRRVPP